MCLNVVIVPSTTAVVCYIYHLSMTPCMRVSPAKSSHPNLYLRSFVQAHCSLQSHILKQEQTTTSFGAWSVSCVGDVSLCLHGGGRENMKPHKPDKPDKRVSHV